MRGHRVRACEVGSVGVGVLVGSRWTFQICCQWIQRYLHRWSKNSPVWKFSCFPFFLNTEQAILLLSGKKRRAELIAFPDQLQAKKSVPSTLVHINTTFPHTGCLEMASSSQVQILVSSSYSFCSTALLFPLHAAGVPAGICSLRTLVSSNCYCRASDFSLWTLLSFSPSILIQCPPWD